MKTRPFRIPIADIKEIEKIANNLKIGKTSAYQIWKRKKGMVKEWQEF